MFDSLNAQKGDRAVSRPEFSRGVDLARLINWDTPLAWFEAVAIVQELCAVLLSARREEGEVDLQPEDVAITADGTVELSGTLGQGMPALSHVAHLMLALLQEAQSLPVQLRLLALQEVSPTPTGTTLRDWSARLATFERPGRQRTIREVYERFVRMPARAAEPPAKPSASVRPKAAASARRWWKNRKLLNAAASVALLVAAGVAAFWLWSVVVPLLSGGADRSKDANAGAAAADSLSEATIARIRAAAFRIWGAAPVRPAAPAPEVAPLAVQPLVVVVPPLTPSLTPAEAAEAPRRPDVPAGTRAAAPDTNVYSVADAAVAPPALLRPRLPTRASTGAREESLPQVELLVSTTGEVESVKLLTQPAGVMSAMMLSAMKTWRFQPATRDGQPVRYRLRLRLTNQ